MHACTASPFCVVESCTAAAGDGIHAQKKNDAGTARAYSPANVYLGVSVEGTEVGVRASTCSIWPARGITCMCM